MSSEPISILKNRSSKSRTRLSSNRSLLGASASTPKETNSYTPRVKFDLSTHSLREYEISRKPINYELPRKPTNYQTDVKTIMDSNAIILALHSQDIKDEVLIKWLDELSDHISLFDKKNDHLVDILLELDWSKKSEPVIYSYCEVILNLVTAFTYHTQSVLKMIVRRFMPVLPPSKETIKLKDLKFDKLHNLLQSILKLIPLSSMQLTPLLIENFPYMKKSWFLQKCYTYNLLEITKYVPSMRKPILELIISKLVQLDVHSSKVDIEEAEMEDEEDTDKNDTMFKMETDEATEAKEELMKHPIARVLDCLLDDLYDYIDDICWKVKDGKRELEWESTKKLYKDLLTIFDFVILPTHASCHVQFLMFYICSFRHALLEGFIDYLWKKVSNPNVSTLFRQVSVCYLGSFICRASYVNIQMVKDCLNLLNNWLNSYIGNLSGSSKNIADINYHGTFYAVSQILFYVIAFRHKDLVEMKDGLLFLQNLNLERLVTCSLNPLKVCLPTVVKNFASIAKIYQIAYCYTVIEKNNRMRLPVVNDLASVSSGYSSFTVLETFFPFDPYILKKSGLKMKPLYRSYIGSLEVEPDEDIDEDEDDFIQDMVTGTTPTSPSNMVDALSYGSSPGFKFSPKKR